MKSRALMMGLLAAGLSTAVQAEEQAFYAGSGAGIYYVDLDGMEFDESAMAVRLFGGYRFNEYVSVEAGFGKLFEASTDIEGVDVDLDGTTWDLSVRPSVPLSDNFTAFAVLGLTQYDLELSASALGVTESTSDKDEDLHYGVGGQFLLNDVWKVRGEWTILDASGGDFGMLSLSAVYNFR